jgi:aminobenzoyl-glutamate transport protein
MTVISPKLKDKFGSAKLISRFLAMIEKGGNALPHPAMLFAIMACLAVVVSGITSLFHLSVIHPGTGETIRPNNLLSVPGLHYILRSMVTNFTGFAPLGTVLVAMLGIGIAEGSGLIGAVLRVLVLSAPRRLLTFVIVLAGVISNTASEIGYVLLVPLAGIIFLAAGRHPIAGLAAAFAGVSGGYSANLLLGTIDPLLAGLSQEAAQIVDPEYLVNPACNYYFMVVSTFLIAAAGTWVTERIVIPRLGEYTGEEKAEDIKQLTREEKRGMRNAVITLLAITAVLLLGTVPANGFLRNPETGGLLHSPFLSGIVALVFIVFGGCGVAYGIGAGTYKSDTDVVMGMANSMKTLSLYMVLIFFASQFVAYFNETNLGLIVAVKGAQLLNSSGLTSIPLVIAFVLIAGFLNLFMGSASAKWALMAPVFIPMFMLLDNPLSPEFTQVAYRIGDSTTNIIAPMMAYFALIVAFVERYDEKAGIGTVIATMLPYTVVFLVVWIVLLVVWMLLGAPVGPGAPIYMPS